MSEKFVCKMPGCDGYVNPSSEDRVVLQTGCSSYSCAYPCEKCGRYYFGPRLPATNRQDERLFKSGLDNRPFVSVYGFQSEKELRSHKNAMWAGEATSEEDLNWYVKQFPHLFLTFYDGKNNVWMSLKNALKMFAISTNI